MLHAGAALAIGELPDTRPPLWWIGLFASPGGLLIVGIVILVILIAAVLIRESREC